MKHLTTILDKVANELEARGLKKLAAEVDVVANTIQKSAYGIKLSKPRVIKLYKDTHGVEHSLTIENMDDGTYIDSTLPGIIRVIVDAATYLSEALLRSEPVQVPDMQLGGDRPDYKRYVNKEEHRNTLARVHKELTKLNKLMSPIIDCVEKGDASKFLDPAMATIAVLNDDSTWKGSIRYYFNLNSLRKALRELELIEETFGQASTAAILDKVANELEARGLKKLAAEVDVVANTLEKEAEYHLDAGHASWGVELAHMLNDISLDDPADLVPVAEFIQKAVTGSTDGVVRVPGPGVKLGGIKNTKGESPLLKLYRQDTNMVDHTTYEPDIAIVNDSLEFTFNGEDVVLVTHEYINHPNSRPSVYLSGAKKVFDILLKELKHA